MTRRHAKAVARLLLSVGGVVVGAGLAATAWAAEPAAGVTTDEVRQRREELRHAAIEAPPQSKPSADLNAAIERVQSLRLVPKSTKPTPETLPPQPGERPAVNETPKPAADTPFTEPAAKAGDPKAEAAALVAQLQSVPPEKVSDPVGLADTLFRGGHLDEAYRFYEKSVTKGTPAETKAWVLFQMANCRRTKDPAAAQALYHRVQTEHAASMWASTAAVEERLLQWLQMACPVETSGKPANPAKPANP